MTSPGLQVEVEGQVGLVGLEDPVQAPPEEVEAQVSQGPGVQEPAAQPPGSVVRTAAVM